MAAVPVIGTIGDKVDLLIRQGATFGPYWIEIVDEAGAPIDLTGCVVKASMRKEIGDAVPAAEFTIGYNALEGKFSYMLTKAVTSALVAGATVKDPVGKNFWDCEITWLDGSVSPICYGDATVFREITRE